VAGLTFFHAHLHSDFSVLDAILKVEPAAKAAAEMGQPAMALTDHGTMAGLVQHYQACRKNNIVPILGVEGYLVQNASTHQDEVKAQAAEVNSAAKKGGERKNVTSTQAMASRARRHVLLLARDHEGYQYLTRAMSRAFAQAYYKPLFDVQDIAELGRTGKVVMTTGCANGEIPRLLQQGAVKAAWERLRFYRDIFGENLLVELQHHGLSDVDEARLNASLVAFGSALSLPIIGTSDVHFLRAEDQDIHSFYKRMAYKGKPDAGYDGTGYHLESELEIQARFPEAQWNATRAGYEHLFNLVKDISFPALDSYSYQVPEVVKTNAHDALDAMARARLDTLLMKMDNDGTLSLPLDHYEARLDTELGVIKDTGFAQYFLFVRMIVKYCEDHEIFFVARGSASGSLVCFLLGITQLDPLTNGLLFERFLSNDRSKPPDIDLDVEDERRDEVLRFVSQRFETTQIGTVLTYQLKSTQNEVAAQLRLDDPELEHASDEEILFTDRAQTLIKALGGVAKSIGGHPAGVVAETTGRSVRDLVPLSYISSSERWVTQYDMDDIEMLGFVKVDILGVRSLRTIRRCLEWMGKKDWNWIPDDDALTFKLLQSGKTDGIFTFKGWSSRNGCKDLRPKSFDDCSLVAAIYRPSCTDLGLDKLFLERRKNKWKPPEEWHPAIGTNLAETYGIPVYQEQVIQIMKAFGFTPDEVMVMLRGVKKKDPKLMKIIHDRLDQLVDAETAKQTWELMEGYTRYGFNKSHSYAYATVAYRMAYLKANHPLEFMCAVLETETEKTNQSMYTREARRLGLGVKPVCVLSSQPSWVIERGALRRGLTWVNGVGWNAAVALVKARPFASIQELREKATPRELNLGILKKLAGAGAFTSLGILDDVELQQVLT